LGKGEGGRVGDARVEVGEDLLCAVGFAGAGVAREDD